MSISFKDLDDGPMFISSPWEAIERWAEHGSEYSVCLKELRERITLLEDKENYRQQDEDAERAFGSMSGRVAPPPLSGSLVEVVRHAIACEYDPADHCWDESRAAILAVADWLSNCPDLITSGPFVANHIRAELKRHG